MRPTRREVLATTAATIALAGCTGGSGDGSDGGGGDGSPTRTATPTATPTETTAAPDVTVEMKSTTFRPRTVEVDPGATVQWVNEDGYSHDVTAAQFHDAAEDWSFSERVSGGQSLAYTFEQSGIYEYYCTIHGKTAMCGAVLVGGVTLDESLPCGGGAETTSGGETTTDDGGYY